MSSYAKRCHGLIVLALVALSGVSGCGDAASEPKADPTGTYVLVSINGKPLPGLVAQTADYMVEMLSSSVTINADHRFVFSASTRETSFASVNELTQTGAGSWQLHNALLDIVPDDPSFIPTTTLTWDGVATLTFTDASGTVPVVMVFRK